MKIKLIMSLFALLALAGCAQESGAPQSATADAAATAEVTGEEGASSADAMVAETLPARADIEALLATADADMGKRQFIVCQACHSTMSGGPNKVGPNLYGLMGSPAAQAEGFFYSAALTESGIVWDAAALDQWIENPAAMVPGTTMVFAGLRDPKQRANLIAYLQKVTSD
jgi:cytochrome c